MTNFKIALALLLFCNSCKSQPDIQKSIDNDNTVQATKKTIDLYKVDSIFFPFMPDTNKIFKSEADRKVYYFAMQKKYSEFKVSLINLNEKDKIQYLLLKQQADIMFDDYMQFINYRFIRHSEKTPAGISLLFLYSPYLNLISLESVRKLFETFPTGMKNSESGQKLSRVLESYRFDDNIGYSFASNPRASLKDTAMQTVRLESLISRLKVYNIISFGASWCLPCRLQDLQLKEWLPFIDTSKIGLISISVDLSPIKWKNSLTEDKLPWQTFKLEEGMNNRLIKNLKFETIPNNFLINQNGIILYENTDIRKVLQQIPVLNTNISYTK